jgi:hypothetical protein
MASAPNTTRVAPLGVDLPIGHSTKVAFQLDPDVSLWEMMVTPPGIEGGESVPQTTMWNAQWHTKAPRALKELTDGTFSVGYDPEVYNQIMALINNPGGITVHWPNGATLSFWGYLRSFIPDQMEEGNKPTATCTFVATNYDPTNKVEAGPVMTDPTGTGTSD